MRSLACLLALALTGCYVDMTAGVNHLSSEHDTYVTIGFGGQLELPVKRVVVRGSVGAGGDAMTEDGHTTEVRGLAVRAEGERGALLVGAGATFGDHGKSFQLGAGVAAHFGDAHHPESDDVVTFSIAPRLLLTDGGWTWGPQLRIAIDLDVHDTFLGLLGALQAGHAAGAAASRGIHSE